jgi:hypothetical protein
MICIILFFYVQEIIKNRYDCSYGDNHYFNNSIQSHTLIQDSTLCF